MLIPQTVPGHGTVGPGDFRSVMRRYPTGVVVAAACLDGQPYGMTVNSFASVSLDPLLVLFCADRASRTWSAVRGAGCFAISVLAAAQAETGRVFANNAADRFASVAWSLTGSGQPVLDGAIAWLDCEMADVFAAGDHDIVLGRVKEIGEAGTATPLVYYAGRFMTVTDPAA